MHKALRKVLTTALATLMVAGVGASFNNNNNVHAKHYRVSRHRRKHGKRINLATFNNYGRYEVRITKRTKMKYVNYRSSGRYKTLHSKWIHAGTVLRLSGHTSIFDGPTYVVYGKHSYKNHGNKLSLITLNHHNYKFIKKYRNS